MKRGDRVRVFHDPWTKESLEGIATIVTVLYAHGGESECEVVFDGPDEGVVIRTIIHHDDDAGGAA